MGRGGAETQLFKTLARLPLDRFEAFIVLSREPGPSYDQLGSNSRSFKKLLSCTTQAVLTPKCIEADFPYWL